MNEVLGSLESFYELSNIKHLLIALLISLPVGWNREKETRSMGLRTFPLVAVSSCAYMLIGNSVIGDDPQTLGRLITGLMTGIGFIGGGAILKNGGNVEGTATAASIWNTGAMGAAVAFDRYEIAIVLALLSFLILLFAKPVKDNIDCN